MSRPRFVGAVAILATLVAAFAVSAQAPATALPGALSGRWTFVPPGGRALVDFWSIRFDGSRDPGPVKGTFTWRGRSCGAIDQPVDGTWNGTELRFEARLAPNVNTQIQNGQCADGPVQLVLQRKPGDRAFEGEARAPNATVSVTASP